LVRKFLPAGTHSALWLADDDQGQRLSAGIYVYVLTSDARILHRKACLID
jgi:hypothetical protein